MPNQILEAIQKQSSSQMVNQQYNAMPLIQAIRYSRNPNLMLQQLMQSNPNVASTMNLVRQYGGNPQKAFYEEAKKKGVDPNQILSMLR